MTTRSLRIDEALVIDAQRTGLVEHRSINSQVEYWAKLGRAIASKISITDAYAVTQGIFRICIACLHCSYNRSQGTVFIRRK